MWEREYIVPNSLSPPEATDIYNNNNTKKTWHLIYCPNWFHSFATQRNGLKKKGGVGLDLF